MSRDVTSLDVSKTAAHASNLMTERRVGSVIVTKNGKAFGIVTERDLVRRYSRSTILESLASHPLITAEPSTTVEKVVQIMLENKVRKLSITDESNTIVIRLGHVSLPHKQFLLDVICIESSIKREDANLRFM